MKYRALKTFKGKPGLVRRGDTFDVDEHYGKDLMQNGLAEKHGGDAANKEKPAAKKAATPRNKKAPEPENKSA